MRVFLDTNVLLGALLGRGLCRDLLDLVIERHTLVISGQVLSECERHLRGKPRVPPPERRAFAALLREVGVVCLTRIRLQGCPCRTLTTGPSWARRSPPGRPSW